MHRGLFYFIGCLHFAFMLAYNLRSTLQGYQRLTEDKAGPSHLRGLQGVATAFTSLTIPYYLAQYAGTATGYGFFAPQVGSSFQLEVSLPDKQEVSQQIITTPVFKYPHSLIRYRSLLNSHMQHLSTADTVAPPLAGRRARAIAHCLAQRLVLQRWGRLRSRLRCEVFVYGVPGLWQEQQQQQHPYRMRVYHHDIDHVIAP